MAAPLSYEFDLKTSPGLAQVVAGLGTVGAKVEGADDKIKRLQVQLNSLKAPGEIKRLEKEIADFGKTAKAGFGGIGQAISGAREQTSHFLDFIGASLVVEGIKAVTSAVIDLGKEAINAAAGAERTNLSFEFNLGAEGAKDMLHWIEKIAPATEFTADKLQGWTLQLANAGLKGEALKDNVAAILDVAAKRGPQGAEMAVDALARATLSGKIEGRSLRGLGIPVADLAQLDQFKGLNEKQINKKLETATITKDDMLSLIAGPDKLLGDFAVRASDTMAAKLTHLKDIPDQFFQKFADSPSYDTVKVKLDELLTALDPNGPTGKAIFDGLEGALGTVVELVETIDFKAVGDTIRDDVIPAIKGMAGLIGPTLDAINTTIAGMSAAASAVGKVWNFNFGLGKDAVEHAEKQQAAEVRGTANMPSSELKGLMANSFGTGKSVPEAVAAGATSSRALLASAGAGIGQSLMDGLDNKIERHSPPRVFLRVGRDIPRAVAMGIESESASLDQAIAGAVSVPAPDVAGGAGMGAMSIVIGDIIVHVGEGATREQGQAAGEAAADAFEERMQAFFERKALEQRT